MTVYIYTHTLHTDNEYNYKYNDCVYMPMNQPSTLGAVMVM